MEKYKKVVCFTIGLAIMIFIGGINALFMTPKSEWFSSLVGMCVDGKIHSACWLVVYLLFSIHIGEVLRRRDLRLFGLVLGALIGGSTAWCGVFFRLHSMTGAAVLLFFCTGFAAWLFAIAAKKTRLLVLFTAPVLSWYLYLLFINVFLAVLN